MLMQEMPSIVQLMTIEFAAELKVPNGFLHPLTVLLLLLFAPTLGNRIHALENREHRARRIPNDQCRALLLYPAPSRLSVLLEAEVPPSGEMK